MSRRVTMVARTRRRAVVAREESSSPREETFAAAIATPLDAGTSDGEILLNPRDSPSEGVDVDEHARGDDRHRARDDSAADDARALPDWWKKVDRAPIGVQGVDLVIPRGPYQSGKEATAALKHLAIAEGRSVKVCTTRHKGMRGVLMCKGVTDFKKSGRRELLHGYDCAYTAVIERWNWKRDGAPGTFWITKYVPHTYVLCKSSPSLPSKAIAADERINAIVKGAGTKTTGKAIASAVRRTLGVAITPRAASRVKQHVLSELREDYNTTFKRLPSYARAFEDLNPGSIFYVHWTRESEGAFISLSLCSAQIATLASRAGLRLFAIDACTFRGAHYRGQAIQTVALIDGHQNGANFRNLPICVTVCDDEVQEAYFAHMNMWKHIAIGGLNDEGDALTLHDHIVSKDSVIFIDGGSAIHSAVERRCAGDGHVLSCALHILANVKKHHREPDFKDARFWGIQAATTYEDFEVLMDELAYNCPGAAGFLWSKNPSEWTVWGWIERGAVTYGRRTTNPVEQTHSLQVAMRHCSPLAFIEQYLVDMAELVAELKTTADVLQTRLDRGESPFTPCVQKSIDKARLDAVHSVQRVIATPDNYDVYQVIEAADARTSTAGLRTNHVNALERTCTCHGRAIHGYACMHEYAVYLHVRGNDELSHHLGMTDFLAWAAQPCMHAETFIEAVNNAFVYLPPATEGTLDETRRPPGPGQSATRRARERPRRRISSLGPGGARTITTRSQRH